VNRRLEVRRGCAPDQNSISWKSVVARHAPAHFLTLAVMPISVAMGSHRQTAFLAKLCVLCLHASGYFRYVRNEVGAKPHGIGRASLAGFRRPLSSGAARAKNQRSDRQCQPAEEIHGPQHFVYFPHVQVRHSHRRNLEHDPEKWKQGLRTNRVAPEKSARLIHQSRRLRSSALTRRRLSPRPSSRSTVSLKMR
jgi:hypothetical protein